MNLWMALRGKLVFITALIVIVGCGGGSGGNTTSGNISLAPVEVVTDADAVAYQIGNDKWGDDLVLKETLSNGEKRYSFNQNGRYGIALYCQNGKSLILFQQTTDESRSVHFTCRNVTASASMSGNISDPNDTPAGYAVALERKYDIVNGNSGTFSMTAPTGIRDLVAVSLNNAAVPQKFYIERNINFSGVDIAHTVTFSNTNTVPVNGYVITQGTGTTAEAYLVTSNETFFTAAINGTWYLPQSGLIADDLYAFYGFDSQKKVSALDVYAASEVPKQNRNMDVSYINPLVNINYDNQSLFVGLDYQTSAQSLSMKNYLAMMEKTQTHEDYALVLTKGWLGDAESYTMPNLSSLSGFQAAWQGDNADHATIIVIMSNKNVNEMFTSTKEFTPHGNHLFMIPDIKYEVATQELF